MEMTGNIRKMLSLKEEEIFYSLPLGEQKVELNPLIGHRIDMEFLGKINCIKCGRETKKSFSQGFCYPCFISAPETEECVLRPELCRAHEGIARDMEYAKQHCLGEHVVYLSITSGLKVGVTRLSQVPTRWIDQGAVRAIELARTPNRFTAGLLEVAMKAHMADKTNWRKMLTSSDPSDLDLVQEKEKLLPSIPEDLRAYISENMQVVKLKYPVSVYPEKVKSLNLDKDPVVSGVLRGMKGQYLFFDENRVINMRKFGGYLLRLRAD